MLLPQQRRSHRKTNQNCGLWEIKEFVILGRHHCEKEIRKRMRHVELCALYTHTHTQNPSTRPPIINLRINRPVLSWRWRKPLGFGLAMIWLLGLWEREPWFETCYIEKPFLNYKATRSVFLSGPKTALKSLILRWD